MHCSGPARSFTFSVFQAPHGPRAIRPVQCSSGQAVLLKPYRTHCLLKSLPDMLSIKNSPDRLSRWTCRLDNASHQLNCLAPQDCDIFCGNLSIYLLQHNQLIWRTPYFSTLPIQRLVLVPHILFAAQLIFIQLWTAKLLKDIYLLYYIILHYTRDTEFNKKIKQKKQESH